MSFFFSGVRDGQWREVTNHPSHHSGSRIAKSPSNYKSFLLVHKGLHAPMTKTNKIPISSCSASILLRSFFVPSPRHLLMIVVFAFGAVVFGIEQGPIDGYLWLPTRHERSVDWTGQGMLHLGSERSNGYCTLQRNDERVASTMWSTLPGLLPESYIVHLETKHETMKATFRLPRQVRVRWRYEVHDTIARSMQWNTECQGDYMPLKKNDTHRHSNESSIFVMIHCVPEQLMEIGLGIEVLYKLL